ncbi:oxaloacetate decarboxylase [Caballeronia sp. dw_19]|uniref:isocitrate lyase/PEP mutase family protein n=1 Tax=Caballeronia sp. dw_19 TaxID=2719791 RepID=UPI001BD64EB7|nr:oxaloacetate decarboxylase [Caballeronia sp. dw_19]
MKRTTEFKQYLLAPEILLCPVAHDPLSAKIAQRVGFKAIGAMGYANSAALIAAPDVELLTLTEMVDCAWRIADATDLPVLCDGDTGHGNITNVIRSMKQFEKAGIASIFFEDQVSPKRCGHMSGKNVIPTNEFVAKIKAAVDTRVDEDLMIMARTDALGVHGIEDAIERMHRYIEAGADYAFVEAPRTIEQMRRLTKEIKAPMLANMIPGGATPIIAASELQEMGFAIAIYPNAVTYAYARTATDILSELLRTGTTAGFANRMIEFEEFNALVGLPAIRGNEVKYYAGVEGDRTADTD